MQSATRNSPVICKRMFRRMFSNSSSRTSPKSTPVCLIVGDGIGPEISNSVMQIFDAARVPIEWHKVEFMPKLNKSGESYLPKDLIEKMGKYRVALKAPITTPIGGGYKSVNLQIRKQFDLFANVRPCQTLPNLETKYGYVNLVIIRENTEGEYSGIEHMVDENIAQSVKIITNKGSERIAKFAFDYAVDNGRKMITVCHKANIMRLTDGVFLQTSRKVANKYRSKVKFRESHVDTSCYRLVLEPFMFDILLSPNLYGDILSDLCSGLVGGLGLTPSANMGHDMAIFEAVHGSAPDIANKDLANPTALLLSALMMLEHIDLHEYAAKIRKSLFSTLSNVDNRTRDLGGTRKCSELTTLICKDILKI